MLLSAWHFFLASTSPARAEDKDGYRPYFQFRSGEFNTAWDVHDYWGLSIGANLDRHWGVELAGDVYERYLDEGELSVNTLMPQVRFRYPLHGGRWVPYAIAGGGAVFLQFNDKKGDGIGHNIDMEDWSPGLVGGGGIECFVGKNWTFNLEAKYQWIDSMDKTVDHQTSQYDASSFLATIGFRMFLDQYQHDIGFDKDSGDRFSRLHLGVSYGGAILTSTRFSSSIKLQPEASAYGNTLNQFASLSIGWDFSPNWGVEMVLGGQEHRLQHETLGNLGEYATASLLPLLHWRYPWGEGRWMHHLYGGVGGTHGEFNDGKKNAVVDGDGFYPAAAAGTRLEYFLSNNISLNADAWWNYTWNHVIEVNDQRNTGDISTVQFLLGFRLYMWETRAARGERPMVEIDSH